VTYLLWRHPPRQFYAIDEFNFKYELLPRALVLCNATKNFNSRILWEMG